MNKDIISRIVLFNVSNNDLCVMRLVCKLWKKGTLMEFKKRLVKKLPSRCCVFIYSFDYFYDKKCIECKRCPFKFACPVHGYDESIEEYTTSGMKYRKNKKRVKCNECGNWISKLYPHHIKNCIMGPYSYL